MADTKTSIDHIEKRIEAQIERHNGAKRATVTIYAILIVVILGFYMLKVIPNIKTITKPENVSELVVATAEKQIPAARAEIVRQIQASAPQYAADLIDQGLAEVPKFRKDLEDEFINEVKIKLSVTENRIDEFIDYSYENHADQIRPIIKELDAAGTSEEIESILFELLKQPFDHQELRVELETYGLALQGLAEHLHELRTSTDLDEHQRMEKEVICILKEISKRSG